MAVKKCLVIGDINIDIEIRTSQYPTEGKRTHTEQADLRLGGSGCITAVRLHLMGLPTTLAANMGDDGFSHFVKGHLYASGLDTTLVNELENEQTGFFMTLITPSGFQTVLSNRGANAAALQTEKVLSRLGEFSHLHVSGYSLIGNDQFTSAKQVMEKAESKGITISLDPGVCTSEQAAEGVLGLLKHVDYFLPNQGELASLVKVGKIEGKIETLLDYGCKAVVLKKGNSGAKYFERGFNVEAPAKDIEENMNLNTTGAGDCFNAGFLYGILNGNELERALEAANKAAFEIIFSLHGIVDLIQEAQLKQVN